MEHSRTLNYLVCVVIIGKQEVNRKIQVTAIGADSFVFTRCSVET